MGKKDKTLRPLTEDQLRGARGGDGIYYVPPVPSTGGLSFSVIAWLSGTGAGKSGGAPIGPGPAPGGH
jgi:hypothetical protein